MFKPFIFSSVRIDIINSKNGARVQLGSSKLTLENLENLKYQSIENKSAYF